MNNPDAASGLRSARLRATGAQLVLISLALGASPGIQPALARLGFGGGVGYHPVYGADVRPAVGVGAVDSGFYNRPYAGFHPAWVNCGYWGGHGPVVPVVPGQSSRMELVGRQRRCLGVDGAVAPLRVV
jgi:hypothetical protein